MSYKEIILKKSTKTKAQQTLNTISKWTASLWFLCLKDMNSPSCPLGKPSAGNKAGISLEAKTKAKSPKFPLQLSLPHKTKNVARRFK